MKFLLILGTLFLQAKHLTAHNLLPADSNKISGIIAAEYPAQIPQLTKDQQNRPVLSWVEQLPDKRYQLRYAVSNDNGKSFGEAIAVSSSTTISPHAENAPKIAFKPSGEIIAVWGVTATSLAAERSSQKHEPDTSKAAKLAGFHSSGSANKYAGLIYYSQSFDQGKNWTAARPLVTDPAGNDQRYFDIALNGEGEVVIIWLDNRKSSKSEGSALYLATTYEREGFQQQHKIAETTCQCCRTKLLIDQQQRIHVVYRAILQDTIRDMVHQVSEDGGRNFSAPKRIHADNWIIKTCPHTGPSMTSNSKGLHFAWYSAAPEKASYYVSSADNGKSFGNYGVISELARHPQMNSLPDAEIGLVWDEVQRTASGNYTRIGMEWRSAEGKRLSQLILTESGEMASYPVLLPLEDSFLVAYQLRTEKGAGIGWQLVERGALPKP